VLVRDADAGDFQHARVGHHDLFDFVRVDVEARHQDHVLLAVDDFYVTLRIHDADVAGLEEALRRHDLGRLI
jgi:hypothetical protein